MEERGPCSNKEPHEHLWVQEGRKGWLVFGELEIQKLFETILLVWSQYLKQALSGKTERHYGPLPQDEEMAGPGGAHTCPGIIVLFPSP